MRKLQLLTFFTGIILISGNNIGSTRQSIVHNTDGSYSDILIAIDENVPENTAILTSIEQLLWKASEFLDTATNGQKYITGATILVPATWSHNTSWSPISTETFERARVLIAPANKAKGNQPYTQQPGACGDEGDFIHFTPEWLLDTEISSEFGPQEKTFVHEWAHLRWGLFAEYPDEDDAKFYPYQRRLYPTRCTSHIDGVIRDQTTASGACIFDRSTGFPTSTCDFLPLEENDAKASLMFAPALSYVTSFCGSGDVESGKILHEKASSNKQNKKCNEKSAWELLGEHPDFVNGDTSDIEREINPPIIKVVHDFDPEFVPTTTTTTPTTTTTTTPTTTTTTPTTTTTTSTTTTTTPTTTTTTTPTTTTTSTTTTTVPTTTTTVPTTTTTVDVKVEPVPRKPDVVCLVLDVSGSMSIDNRIGIMGSAVANYIRNYLEDGSVVGIVSFSSSATVLADMTKIVDETTRDELISRLPTQPGGGTSIAAGMLKCGEVLSAYAGDNVASTRMFVLSDGQESAAPYVVDTFSTILALELMVDTIAYSQAADPVLKQIADDTGGSSFYFSGSLVSPAMQDALLATIERRRNKDSPVTLVSDGVTVPTTYTDTVALDASIGRDTRLVFTYYDDLEVKVTTTFNNSITKIIDADFKLVTYRIQGVVTGNITYTLTNVDTSVDENVVISVTSRSAVPGQGPITVSSRMGTNNVDFTGLSTVLVLAQVSQDLTPVRGVTAIALLERPDTSVVLTIALLDDGVGADTTRGDGIYSGVVLSSMMTGDGFYSCKTSVLGYGELPAQTSGGRRKRQTTDTGLVSRTSSGGLFEVTQFDAAIAQQDNFPPDKITDLQLSVAIYGTDYITMQWTAPGDNLSYGTAAGYEVSVWPESHSNKSVTDPLLLLPEQFLETSLNSTLQVAGSVVNLTILTDKLDRTFFSMSDDEELDTFFFRIRAFDDEGNAADWSNEISASFVDPALYEDAPVVVSSTELPPKSDKAQLIAIAVGVSACLIVLVVAIIIAGVVCHKKKSKVGTDPEINSHAYATLGNSQHRSK